MPIYEYVCSKCGDHLEVIQKMDDKPLTRCKKCKGRLEKAVSRSSFAFKGSGWYVTDSRNKSSAVTDSPSETAAAPAASEKPAAAPAAPPTPAAPESNAAS